MAAIRSGDQPALKEFLARHWPRLVAYARRLLSDHDAAEDVAQEAILSAWAGGDERAMPERMDGFLYRAARNLALNERRRAGVRAKHSLGSEARPDPPPTPLQLAERSELAEAVRMAVDSLPPRRREIFVLARYHGYRYREIAEIMEISPQTVANQMSAALVEVRQQLLPYLDEAGAKDRLRVL